MTENRKYDKLTAKCGVQGSAPRKDVTKHRREGKMDAFCPHCHTKYDAEMKDQGWIIECDVCHKEFQINVGGAKRKNKMSVNAKALATNLKGTSFMPGSSHGQDTDFSVALRIGKGLFFLSAAISLCAPMMGGMEGGPGGFIVGLVAGGLFALVNFLAYSLLLAQFEIVKHLREIRDAKPTTKP